MSNPNKKRWDPADYADVDAKLKSSGKDPFAYSRTAMKTGSSLHPINDPRKHGYRRSADLPDALKTSIALITDVTGSGRDVPGIVRNTVPQMQGLLSVGGYVQFPDIQFSFVGDATCDQYPLQIPEFESSAENLDDTLTHAVLEGGGGGQMTESYELMMWYMNNMNKLDCWNRGEKGFMFISGDENPYPYVSSDQIQKYITGKAEDQGEAYEFLKGIKRDIPLQQVVDDAMSKYHVYYIISEGSSWYGDARVEKTWRSLLGDENYIQLRDASEISRMVASIVGHRSGVRMDKIQQDLANLGSDSRFIDNVTMTLAMGSNSGSTNIVPKTNLGSKAKRF